MRSGINFINNYREAPDQLFKPLRKMGVYGIFRILKFSVRSFCPNSNFLPAGSIPDHSYEIWDKNSLIILERPLTGYLYR